MIEFKIFPEDIIAAVSEKSDGPMKNNGANRAAFFRKLGIDPMRAVSAGLVHGNSVKIISSAETGLKIEETDGLVTKEKSLFLTVTISDCLPVFYYDPVLGAVGIAHAGWRGLEKKIPKIAVEKLEELGSIPSEILAAVGPGIGSCHFEVQEDVAQRLEDYTEAILRHGGKIYLDLKKIAREQLIEAGLREDNIEINPDCTYDYSSKYFSFRRDRPIEIQAMVAVIGMK